MKLVVDTNILVSFFRENPVRYIITNSKSLGIELLTPTYAFKELEKNKSDIIKYSKLKTDKELEFIITLLKSFIEIIPEEPIKEFEKKGKGISPDPKDSPFFALALKLNCPIWSNEPRLKEQSFVRIFSTLDLRKELHK